jgi:hypothetical protein
VFERALKSSGDLLVTFMGEQDTYRVNHRFMRPFIGGSKDALIARASKGNKNLIQAIRMATKKLMLERQVCVHSMRFLVCYCKNRAIITACIEEPLHCCQALHL